MLYGFLSWYNFYRAEIHGGRNISSTILYFHGHLVSVLLAPSFSLLPPTSLLTVLKEVRYYWTIFLLRLAIEFLYSMLNATNIFFCASIIFRSSTKSCSRDSSNIFISKSISFISTCINRNEIDRTDHHFKLYICTNVDLNFEVKKVRVLNVSLCVSSICSLEGNKAPVDYSLCMKTLFLVSFFLLFINSSCQMEGAKVQSICMGSQRYILIRYHH